MPVNAYLQSRRYKNSNSSNIKSSQFGNLFNSNISVHLCDFCSFTASNSFNLIDGFKRNFNSLLIILFTLEIVQFPSIIHIPWIENHFFNKIIFCAFDERRIILHRHYVVEGISFSDGRAYRFRSPDFQLKCERIPFTVMAHIIPPSIESLFSESTNRCNPRSFSHLFKHSLRVKAPKDRPYTNSPPPNFEYYNECVHSKLRLVGVFRNFIMRVF